MDEAARRQYCGLLMFDIPPQNLKRNNDVQCQFIIDETELQMRPSLRKTPRPPNAFILYRREKQPEITAHYGNITNSKISKILAKMWRNEKDDIKMYWQRLADRKKMEHSQAHPVHIDKSTSTTTIVAKPIATAATTTATLTPAPAADTFIKSLLPQLSSSHDNNILNIIPSTGDADDPGYINTNDNINNHRIIPHTPCINNSYFIADNNNYEPSISSPLSPLTPLTPLPTPILSTP
ncbi:8791_t:CDS:2, partial [Entrophospora sp. SA101]